MSPRWVHAVPAGSPVQPSPMSVTHASSASNAQTATPPTAPEVASSVSHPASQPEAFASGPSPTSHAQPASLPSAPVATAPHEAPPVARAASFHVTSGQVLNGDVTATASGAKPFTVSFVSGGRHGSLALSVDGEFTYVPDPGFQGHDEFAYRLTDGSGTYAGADAFNYGVWTSTVPADEDANAGAASFSVVTTGATVPITTGPTANDATKSKTWSTQPPFSQ